jgi:hypothetical protein
LEEVGPGSASGNGISNAFGISFQPAIAVAPKGKPIVAWRNLFNGQYEIHLLQYIE